MKNTFTPQLPAAGVTLEDLKNYPTRPRTASDALAYAAVTEEQEWDIRIQMARARLRLFEESK